jgi:hypothetical protein
LEIATSFLFRSNDIDLLIQTGSMEIHLRILVYNLFENRKSIPYMHIISRFKAGLEGACKVLVPFEHYTLELFIL